MITRYAMHMDDPARTAQHVISREDLVTVLSEIYLNIILRRTRACIIGENPEWARQRVTHGCSALPKASPIPLQPIASAPAAHYIGWPQMSEPQVT